MRKIKFLSLVLAMMFGVASVRVCAQKPTNNAQELFVNSEEVRQSKKEAEKRKGTDEYDKALGKCCEKSDQYYTVIQRLKRLAKRGDVWAQYNLGLCYFTGCGVEVDYNKAVKWYRLAAEQGYAPAQYNLGICCAIGLGIEQDYIEAAKWLRKSSK